MMKYNSKGTIDISHLLFKLKCSILQLKSIKVPLLVKHCSHDLASSFVLLPFCAIYVTFPLIDEPGTSLVAWTTTPWTLPSNLALAVNPEFEYQKI